MERQGVESQIEVAGIVFAAAGSHDGGLGIPPFELQAEGFDGGGFVDALRARDFVETVKKQREPARFAQGFGRPADFRCLFREELGERLIAGPIAEIDQKRERRGGVAQSAAGEFQGELAEGGALAGAGRAQKGRSLDVVEGGEDVAVLAAVAASRVSFFRDWWRMSDASAGSSAHGSGAADVGRVFAMPESGE